MQEEDRDHHVEAALDPRALFETGIADAERRCVGARLPDGRAARDRCP